MSFSLPSTDIDDNVFCLPPEYFNQGTSKTTTTTSSQLATSTSNNRNCSNLQEGRKSNSVVEDYTKLPKYTNDDGDDDDWQEDDENVMFERFQATTGQSTKTKAIKPVLTEYDKLLQLQKRSSTLTRADADGNAKLRARFSKDRKEKRRRLGDKGWRNGMELLGSPNAKDINDQIASKDAVYGRPRHNERRTFSKMRQSSIFSSGGSGGGRGGSLTRSYSERRRQQQQQTRVGDGSTLDSSDDAIVSGAIPISIVSSSSNAAIDHCGSEENENNNSNNNDGGNGRDHDKSSSNTKLRTKRKISSVISASGKAAIVSSAQPDKTTTKPIKTAMTVATSTTHATNSSTLGDMLAGYGSDSD